jgi:protein-S-isoprenylcysteine O-methyltransferase Ste14
LLQGAAAPRWVDPVFRFSAAIVTAWFVTRTTQALYYSLDGDPYQQVILVLLVLSELISLASIIIARQPTIRDINLAYMALTVVASFIVPLFISVRGNTALLPPLIGDIASAICILWIIYAKLSLGRSFGLLAAKRIIKIKGAYSLVRHPIYAGYFAMYVVFLLTNYDPLNLAVILIHCCMQVMRALREETVLLHDMSYQDYCQRVPYRFVYGIF